MYIPQVLYVAHIQNSIATALHPDPSRLGPQTDGLVFEFRLRGRSRFFPAVFSSRSPPVKYGKIWVKSMDFMGFNVIQRDINGDVMGLYSDSVGYEWDITLRCHHTWLAGRSPK